MGHVPALIHNGVAFAESVAIIDYLDRRWPEKPLFPGAIPILRARTIQICEVVNSGIQPYQNLKVAERLRENARLESRATRRLGSPLGHRRPLQFGKECWKKVPEPMLSAMM